MSELHPRCSEELGLCPALRWYAKDFSERNRDQVTITGDGRPAACQAACIFYRIAQEALQQRCQSRTPGAVQISRHIRAGIMLSTRTTALLCAAELSFPGAASRR